ncbi:20295_t:CDS:1, partial [Dentiscutata erythropus]
FFDLFFSFFAFPKDLPPLAYMCCRACTNFILWTHKYGKSLVDR